MRSRWMMGVGIKRGLSGFVDSGLWGLGRRGRGESGAAFYSSEFFPAIAELVAGQSQQICRACLVTAGLSESLYDQGCLNLIERDTLAWKTNTRVSVNHSCAGHALLARR